MKNVSEVLVEYKKELRERAAGADLGDSSSRLSKNLEAVIKRNRMIVYLIVGMLILSFILAVAFIWYWRENTTVLVGVFAATGITIPWTIKTMTSLWKDISRAETLNVLVAHLKDENMIKQIVDTLTQNLYKE
jgi:ABC-type multidrug transport system fused ATPase/permease subunit